MLPFSDIPYGPPPAYAYPIFESGMYLIFILCFIHALKTGIAQVSYLVGGLFFGLLLEYVNVVTNMGYVYGQFWVMLGKAPKNIPLCIGVGWGIIMYSARLYTDSVRLKIWPSAALDALLAITIDLTMDTVAYRLHMWHWNWEGTGINPLKGDWFGVPYGNFFGWLCVVFFYSLVTRLLQKVFVQNDKVNDYKQILPPLLSVIISQVLLYVTLVYIDEYLKVKFGITAQHRLVASLVLLFVAVAYGLIKRRKKSTKLPPITLLTPAFFHIYFLAFLYIGGFYKENAWLFIIPVDIIILSAVVHLLPIVRWGKTVKR